MRSIDEYRQILATGHQRRFVERGAWRGKLAAGADQPELRTEAGDPLRFQRRIGAIVDAQNLVVESVAAGLVFAAERCQRACRLASHIVEIDDH